MNTDSYIGAVAMFVGDFAPEGWLPCDGRRLNLNEHQALFSIIGSRYGGDNQTYFNLPNFAGVFPTGMPVNQSAAKPRKKEAPAGALPGQLSIEQANLPAHVHSASFAGQALKVEGAPVTLKARTGTGANVPTEGAFLGAGGSGTNAATIYVPATPAGTEVNLGGASVSLEMLPRGAVTVNPFPALAPGQTHTATPLQTPFLEINFCICVRGLFPSRQW